jgi:cell division protein FtsA
VYVGIAGAHIRGQNSLGIVPVKGREVRKEDVERAIAAARAIAIPLDRQIIHTIPQYYLVDEQDGIIDPLGMAGVRLEAKAHIVTGAVTSIQNVIKSISRIGLEVKELVLEQLAASEAVLSNDEKALGAALIDIGGGTTDIAVFSEGSIKHTAVLPVGGQYVTSDISTGLRTPLAEAEKIKIEYGCAYMPLIPKDEMIEVPSVGGREPRDVSRQILGRIIEPRMDEILVMAQKEISRSGCEDILAAGIVLTGGGAILEGIPELAEQIFNMPVRRGVPMGILGLTDIVNSPLYATGVGLVLYAARNITRENMMRMEGNYINRLYRRFRQWILDFY